MHAMGAHGSSANTTVGLLPLPIIQWLIEDSSHQQGTGWEQVGHNLFSCLVLFRLL
jgi:hypothetical protein